MLKGLFELKSPGNCCIIVAFVSGNYVFVMMPANLQGPLKNDCRNSAYSRNVEVFYGSFLNSTMELFLRLDILSVNYMTQKINTVQTYIYSD